MLLNIKTTRIYIALVVINESVDRSKKTLIKTLLVWGEHTHFVYIDIVKYRYHKFSCFVWLLCFVCRPSDADLSLSYCSWTKWTIRINLIRVYIVIVLCVFLPQLVTGCIKTFLAPKTLVPWPAQGFPEFTVQTSTASTTLQQVRYTPKSGFSS